MRVFILSALLPFVLAALPAGAEDRPWTDRLRLSGLVETIQSFRLNDTSDQVTSRLHSRLELGADLDLAYVFVSADAEKNWKIPSETKTAIHEAWVEHIHDGWDVRAGRQIIIWGKADGVQITDIICPPDNTEALIRDLDEIRRPVDALRFRLLRGAVDAEAIWIPAFRPAKLPGSGTPWAVERAPGPVRVDMADTDEPGSGLENSEIALKISAYLPGMDVAASVFHTWDDFPAMHRDLVRDGGETRLRVRPRHHRLTVYGLEFSRPWSDFVFRGEAAWYAGRYFEHGRPEQGPRPKDALKWLGGVDWTPGDDWTVIAQIFGQSIAGHGGELAAPEHDVSASLNISKGMLRQTLTLSNMLYFHFNEGDFLNRVKADYELRDGLHLLAGLDFFGGGDTGFGVYEDNSQVWIKLKYNF